MRGLVGFLTILVIFTQVTADNETGLKTQTFQLPWPLAASKVETMRLSLITGFIILILFTASGQETRVKGLLIPFFEHSIGVEQKISKRLSIQILYVNRAQPSITQYYYHRLIPSFRYYILSQNQILDHLFFEVFYRYAYTKQIPDQSPVNYFYSNSVGLDIGKQRLIADNFFIEGSLGYYYIYSGKDPKSPLDDLRIDIKFGIRIKYNNI